MSKWILKAVVQKAISFLPYRNRINLWFQKNITKGVELSDEHFQYKIEHARDHLEFLSENTAYAKSQSTIMELGTGWYPIVPLCLFLAGYKKIISIDLNAWLKKEGQLAALKRILDLHQAGTLKDYVTDYDESRLAILQKLWSEREHISYEAFNAAILLVPRVENLITTDLPDHCVEFICSNNTFEHIYPKPLKAILARMQRLLKPQGSMSHFIDMSDHFAHFDQSITVYNFLKFSKSRWQLLDNEIQPQNRLRFSEYKKMYEELGLVVSREVVRPYDLSVLDGVRLHSDYKDFERADLGVLHGYLVSHV